MIDRLFTNGELDAYIVLNPSDRRYFTNLDTSFGCAVISAGHSYFLTDSRYKLAVESALPSWNLRFIGGSELYAAIAEIVRLNGFKRVGLEYNYVSYDEYKLIRDTLPEDVTILPCDNVMIELRAVKTDAEIEKIASAQATTENALQKVLSVLKPRMTERDLYAEFTYQALKSGADGMAFDPIIASGAASAEPHHKITDQAVGHGVPVLFDVGARREGYCGDLSRTVCIGAPTAQMQKVFEHVLHAQTYALSKIKAGITCREADSFAREMLRANGYGEEFGHSLGHGVGLDIHEFPRVAENNDVVLQPNMVITVEPGVYIPGVGGVRIEDTVVVTEDGIRNLTSMHKKFGI